MRWGLILLLTGITLSCYADGEQVRITHRELLYQHNEGIYTGYLKASLVQGRNKSFQEKTDRHRQDDNVEGYIYAHLDAFLKNPKSDRLHLLDDVDNSLWRSLQSPSEQLALVVLLCNKGYYQNRFNQIAESISTYERAWSIYDDNALEGFDLVEYCLKPLGNAYSMLGDYNSAEKIVKSYLMKARSANNHAHLASALINLSIIYHSTGQNEEAVSILKKGLAANNIPEEKKGLFYANLAKNYLALEHYDVALDACHNALSYLRQHPLWNYAVHLATIYSTRSIIHQKVNHPQKALQDIRIANAIADTCDLLKIRTSAKIRIQLAGILSDLERNTASLDLYKKILQQLIPGYKEVGRLPGKASVYAENTLKEVFDGMAQVYAKTDSLSLALQCYALSFEVEDRLRSTYNYRQAKYLQQHENRKRAEDAITLHLKLYKRNNREKHIRKAFEIAENTKSLVLKSVHYKRQYWDHTENDTLAKKHKTLKLQKAQLQHAIIREQLKGNDANLKRIEHLIDQQNKVMVAIKQNKTNGLPEIDRALPYMRGTTPDSLQKTLGKHHQTLVQYFMGNKHLFIFVLDGQKIRLFKADVSIKEKLRAFITYFSDRHKINNDPDGFAQTAFQLHEQLMPVKTDSTLIIVPDGILNFVPFEALLYELPGHSSYEKWPWLLKTSPIIYRTSAMEFLQQDDIYHPESGDFLGVFPEFKNSPRFLKYSSQEADAIQRYFDGTYLYNHNATKQAFLENAADYPIIHLSTHAEAGSNIVPPSIAFRDSALYLPEIYGLDIRNKLMVLSACETGLGKVHKGEGARSLANGFVQAGVSNIVFSLWQVNDYATAVLMSHFYKHYEQSKSAGHALRKAKIAFLKNPEVAQFNKSPYFWASFVYYGDAGMEGKPDTRRDFTIATLIFGLGVLIVIILGYLKFRQKLR